jgi:hypothetical protein
LAVALMIRLQALVDIVDIYHETSISVNSSSRPVVGQFE